MYIRQIAPATALYVVLAIFGAIAQVPDIDPDNDRGARTRAWQAAPAAAQPYVPETEILHLREENIIP